MILWLEECNFGHSFKKISQVLWGGGSRSLDLPLRSATDRAAPLCNTQNLKVVEVIEFLFTFEYWCLDRE